MEVVVEMFRKLGLRQVLVTRDGYVDFFAQYICFRSSTIQHATDVNNV
jgi:hypothetical protein